MADQTEPTTSQSDDDTTALVDANRTQPLIITLEDRSKALKNNANIALLMIVALLIGGGIALYNIDEILGQRSGELDISDATQQLSDLKGRVEEVKKQVIAKDATVAKAKSAIERLSDTPTIGVEEAFARLIDARQKTANIEADLKATQRRREPEIRALRDLEDQLARIDRDLNQSKGGLTLKDSLDRLRFESDNIGTFENETSDRLEQARVQLAQLLPESKSASDMTDRVRQLERDLTVIQRDRQEKNNEIDRTTRELSSQKEQKTVVSNRIAEARRAVAEYDADIAKLGELITANKAAANELETSLSATRNRVDQISKDITGTRAIVDKLIAENGEATQLINNAQGNLEAKMIAWDAGLKKLKTDADSGGQTKIWSSLGTRAALIVILLFLVQILVTLYRYNMRLASFYDARIDALKLAGTCSIGQLGLLIAQLSPEQLDFGKTPSSVTEQAFDLAKSLLSRDTRKPGSS